MSNPRIRHVLSAALIATMAGATPASANTGLPMIAVAYPTFLLFFIPIVVIEWLRIKKELPGASYLFGKITLANGVSTLVGIPITWMVLAAAEMLSVEAIGTSGLQPNFGPWLNHAIGLLLTSPWLYPQAGPELMWSVAWAFLVLLIPFFFTSYWVEYAVMRICTSGGEATQKQLKTAVWWGNIDSYLFLTGIVLLYVLIYALLGKEVVGGILHFILYQFPVHAKWAIQWLHPILTPLLELFHK